MTTTGLILVIIAAAIVIGIAAWYFLRQRRSKTLRSHFGPEYEHAIRQFGGQREAEEALRARQRRMEKIPVHSLSPREREHFAALWHDVQARFVDDPSDSIRGADALVSDVMRARGYPMAEFEHRAEDISVDYPQVVRNYRAAHAIALQDEKGEASTEDRRHALVYYRDLFDELLEAHATREVRR